MIFKKMFVGTKPLGFQKVELDNGQPRRTWLIHFVVSFKIGEMSVSICVTTSRRIR
jgi:hypothetical protein